MFQRVTEQDCKTLKTRTYNKTYCMVDGEFKTTEYSGESDP
jgi:hypothetical protein